MKLPSKEQRQMPSTETSFCISVPHPDHFWAYCYLEVKDWIN